MVVALLQKQSDRDSMDHLALYKTRLPTPASVCQPLSATALSSFRAKIRESVSAGNLKRQNEHHHVVKTWNGCPGGRWMPPGRFGGKGNTSVKNENCSIFSSGALYFFLSFFPPNVECLACIFKILSQCLFIILFSPSYHCSHQILL